jgi:peroxiredoxin
MTARHHLLALCCAAVLAAPAAEFPTLAIGAKAPDFDLPGVDGKNHALAEYAAAKVLVIVFTCNHCPTAQAYEGRIQAIVDDYRPKGVTLVAINPNSNRGLRLDELGYTDVGDSLAEMKLRAADHQFTYPYLDDGETQAVAKLYGPRVTPHAFVFDAQRALRYEGRIDDSERLSLAKVPDLRNAIDALLAGKEIEAPHTKAAGCSTKWLGKEEAVKEWNAKVAAEPVALEPVDAAGLKALKANAGDKLRLVTAWNTTCAPCIHELPEFVTINRMYRKRDFELVTLSTNFPDEQAAALKVLSENQVAMRNLIFAGTDKYQLMEAFDPEWEGETPYTLLIAPGGKVLKRWVGVIEPLEVKRAIVAQLGRVYGK